MTQAATGAAGVCVALSSITESAASLAGATLCERKLAKQGQFILAVMTQSITETVTVP